MVIPATHMSFITYGQQANFPVARKHCSRYLSLTARRATISLQQINFPYGKIKL
jgi:hypothetical protein